MKPLRAWRLEKLLSAARLAEAAGVSNRTVIDIEHGRVRPKLRTIARLTQALQVHPADVTEFAAVIRPGGMAPAAGEKDDAMLAAQELEADRAREERQWIEEEALMRFEAEALEIAHQAGREAHNEMMVEARAQGWGPRKANREAHEAYLAGRTRAYDAARDEERQRVRDAAQREADQ